MADIQGVGNCGICGKPMQDPKTGAHVGPVRHFKGHLMAHKGCYDAWSADDERLARAKEVRGRLTAQIGAMQTDLAAAQKVIDELEPVTASTDAAVS